LLNHKEEHKMATFESWTHPKEAILGEIIKRTKNTGKYIDKRLM